MTFKLKNSKKSLVLTERTGGGALQYGAAVAAGPRGSPESRGDGGLEGAEGEARLRRQNPAPRASLG